MRFVVLSLLLAACADRLESYAYITKTHAYITRNGDHHVDHCDMVAKLPHGLIATKPADDDTSLLAEPMTVTGSVDDSNNDCSAHLHTWMHVTFPPDDRMDIELDPPDPGLSFVRIAAFVIALLVVPALARDKWRARRQRRRR